MRDFENAAVRAAYAAFPDSHRDHLMAIRERILDVADELQLPGGVEETLKWGEPSYVPAKPRTGSAVRTGCFDEHRIALYFHCRSMLVERFRSVFGDRLAYAGNRAVLLELAEPLPNDEIRGCTRMALRYHLDKRHWR